MHYAVRYVYLLKLAGASFRTDCRRFDAASKTARLDARPAMNSPSRCAVGIINASCHGDEATWWRKAAIDPAMAARMICSPALAELMAF